MGWFRSDPDRAGVADGLGTFRFGGVPFGAMGDAPGTFPLGVCLSPGEAGAVGFPPDSVGERPGIPDGFVPSRFGGTSFLPAVGAFAEVPGIAFALGELAPGFTKLAGAFCPAPDEPVTSPLLPICGFTKGVGFARSFGGGFCSAMVFLSFSAS